MTVESYLKGWDSERLSYEVLRIIADLEDNDLKLVRQLWADREYLFLRIRTIAEGLEGFNTRDEIAEWAREGYESVA